MSFQGDVAGLGLGELLQGLARGGQEGVLTLYGGGSSATLGVVAGQIHLLPEPDEDPEIWRKRCGRAWPDDDNQRIDSLRMIDVAKAARVERMFEMLDCSEVHFRFEPGPLPNADPAPIEATVAELSKTRTKRIEVRVPVFCPPVSVEYLLLEHARLSDECTAHGDSKSLSTHEVLCPLVDTSQRPGDKLFAECDGSSDVGEISDRLAWPLRQTKATATARLADGSLRLASANELAALTRAELVQNRFLRAASRLSGWAQNAAPGVPDAGEAELLIEEWSGGKLLLALAGTTSSDARTVLRRMELAQADPKASLARWKEVCKHHRHDQISQLHVLRLGLTLEDESQKPAFADLFKVARRFQEEGKLLRAGAMLTAAATRNPEGTQNRLELGNRLLACGLVKECSPWILDACRTLMQSGLADKAIAPLRALVTADPTNRDARSLFNVTRSKTTQGKAKTRNLWLALAGVVMLGLMAMVQVHSDREIDRRLIELEGSNQRPELSLRVLDEDFRDSRHPHVLELKRALTDAIRKRDMQDRDAWLAKYDQCQQECESGDPLLGLETALDLPEPPELTLLREPWPTVSDVLQTLAGRLEQSVGLLGQSDLDDPASVRSEKRLSIQVRDLIALGEAKPRGDVLDGFQVRLRHLLATLHGRDEQRAAAVRTRATRERDELQEQLLAAAKAHAKAGDLDRASATYKELCDLDPTGKLYKVLAADMQAIEDHRQAAATARELALEGHHEQAIRELGKVCDTPWEHLLPWRVQSTPSGAKARFADGSIRTTPFVVETAPGEALDFSLELAGCESTTVHSDGPADMAVTLSRLPQRWWRTGASVDAAPVALEDDHLLVDRQGNLVRLGASSALRWEQRVNSLSGIARAPVFLPGRAGSLLCLTEDGTAWIVDGSDGHLEGPWDVGSPPVAGPYVEANRVRARFNGGRQGNWDSRLKPDFDASPDPDAAFTAVEREASRGSDSGLEMLRRRDVGRVGTHDSPWCDWTVEIREGAFLVRERTAGGRSFSVRRQGEWSFVAWEAPRAKLPQGRLWVSDGAGVRGFEP